MPDVLKPRDADDVREAVAAALAAGKRLELRGGGSKSAIGRPMRTDAVLDLSSLSGVTLYEPEELILSAQSGTPLAGIEALLAQRNQNLAFEPMDYGPLFGAERGGATLGGVIAANVSGPRRLKAGAARDHTLGFSAVSGRGEAFKGGGRVVKNVTGYDLPKLMAGSWGTLAALTSVTVKVMPRPEQAATILVLGLSDAEAAKAMATAMGSSAEVSGAAHLPAWAAEPAPGLEGAGRAVTALRIEGFAPSVAARRGLLTRLLAPFGPVEAIGDGETAALWRFIRDAEAFAADMSRPVWRLSVAPTSGAAAVEDVARGADVQVYYDWAGGLAWLSVPPSSDACAPLVRRAVRAAGGGHATLIRADESVRSSVPVFEPEATAFDALSRRVKDSFDPRGLLNPGRMRPEV